jgi:hypothetical protein
MEALRSYLTLFNAPACHHGTVNLLHATTCFMPLPVYYGALYRVNGQNGFYDAQIRQGANKYMLDNTSK